jgi:hypothetical protein
MPDGVGHADDLVVGAAHEGAGHEADEAGDHGGLLVRVEDRGSGVADVAGDVVALHRLEDVSRALDQGQAGGLAVHSGAQGGDDGVGSGDGGVDGVGVGHLADDDADPARAGPGWLRWVRVRG